MKMENLMKILKDNGCYLKGKIADGRLQITNFCYLLFVICCLIIIGCNQKKETIIPQNIIPKDTMALMMTDVQIAEAKIVGNLDKDGKSKINPQEYYYEIYQKYQINEKKFKESFTFYTAHPELFDEIYEEVVTQLKKQQK